MEQLIMEEGKKEFIQISHYIDYEFQINIKNKDNTVKSKIFTDYKKALNYYNRLKP